MDLSRDQLLEIDYYLRLTRTLEERLVALFRQAKVIGGLYRSLGQEGDVVRVAALDVPAPYSPPLEKFYLPDKDKVVAAARERWRIEERGRPARTRRASRSASRLVSGRDARSLRPGRPLSVTLRHNL